MSALVSVHALVLSNLVIDLVSSVLQLLKRGIVPTGSATDDSNTLQDLCVFTQFIESKQ